VFNESFACVRLETLAQRPIARRSAHTYSSCQTRQKQLAVHRGAAFDRDYGELTPRKV
jgi:hypothetical protein